VSRPPAVPLATLAPVLLAGSLAVLAGCGSDDEGHEASKPASTRGTATTDTQPTDTRATTAGCKEVEQPAPRDDGGAKRPRGKVDQGRRYEVTLVTSCGELTFRLAVKTSPKASASFVSLARSGFFDDTIFHRIVPGFVIQGGDPTASGSGGPGSSTVDKPPPGTTYPKGVVAMAKTAQEPAGTAGSQFYMVTGDAVQLPPDYAVRGKVLKGLDVAERIGQLGDPNSGDAGTPLQAVVIERTGVHVGA
jgi:peptidyl-prolyl cis-trans isomerase B (cyclophilin B)